MLTFHPALRPLFPALLLPVLLLFGLKASAQTSSPCTWNPDYNGDNAIGISDLLALLSVFEEVDNDDDGIFDSQDDCVGIVDPCGVCNGTGVDADADGICDDADPCVGALDECGLCNGPGPTFPIIDEIIYATDSVYLPPVGSWYVFTYAVDTLYTYVCPVQGCTDPAASNFSPSAVIEDGSCLLGPAQCGGQSTVTFDGYTYALVGIGTQCWFKENLRSDNYLNGDPILGGLSDSQWSSATSGAQAVYNNDSSNLATYGRLYNWYAVVDSRGLCPTGWHVPGAEEWNQLIEFLGGPMVTGAALKASFNDVPSWNGFNTSGFKGLPAGDRFVDGLFQNEGNQSFFWSTAVYGPWTSGRFLFSGGSGVGESYSFPHHGYSIRCVKDSEDNTCHDPDVDGICAEYEVSGCTDSSATNYNPLATADDGLCSFLLPSTCNGESTVTFNGHEYDLVGIGSQCWFSENLRSDKYRNGDEIPGNLSDSQWSSTTSGAQTVYGEGLSPVYSGSNDEVSNLATYGRLYNWYAVQDSRGICPSGFHVPTDQEWTILENNLGGPAEAGISMKAAPPAWNGTSTNGFSALPGGSREFSAGFFSVEGFYGHWWSSSSYATIAWTRELYSENSNVSRYTRDYRYGLSVRCLQD